MSRKPQHIANDESAALPAETAAKLRELVRVLARMAAEADHEAMSRNPSSPKGSDS